MQRKALQIGLAMLLAGSVLFLALTLLQRKTHAQGGGTVYVAPGAECGGMIPCYAHPQDAVDAASQGDTIKVAAGTYTGVSRRTRKDIVTTGVVTQVVYLSKTLTIRGGYTAADWTTCDPVAHPTTLDAQGQGRLVYITGDIRPMIEGLRITGGNAAGLGGAPGLWYNDAGGGVYIITATATIINNQILSNTVRHGGGLYLYHSHAMLSGNTVTANTAGQGGGLRVSYSDVMLSGNTVSGNTAGGEGGGLYLHYSQATLSGNTVTANTAGEWGGGLYLWGSDATLCGNTIIANTASDDGGGLYLEGSDATLTGNTVSRNTTNMDGGGLFVTYYSSVTMTSNTVCGNTARYSGGGLMLYERSSAAMTGNTVCNNTAAQQYGYGGGLYLGGSDATLTGNTVCSNTAYDNGGGLCLYGSGVTLTNNIIADNQTNAQGSGLYLMGSLRLLHTTIARNGGGDGSGVYVTGNSTVALTNTILVSHTVGIVVTADNTATLEATLWGSGAWANGTDWGGAGSIITGTRNYWGDPAFVDPDAGNYHIPLSSAAIDRGVDAGVRTDIDHEPRPYQMPDLGADEYWPPGILKYVYLPLVPKNQP